ncbi:hypothetical protein KEM55_001218, partial [Ascosphaera atra]
RLRDLRDMLGRLHDSAAGGFRREPAGAVERLDDARGRHATDQAQGFQGPDHGQPVPVETLLAPGDLRPIHPVGDGVGLVPEAGEDRIVVFVVAE